MRGGVRGRGSNPSTYSIFLKNIGIPDCFKRINVFDIDASKKKTKIVFKIESNW
jgi:hypothetical protein